jgi:hypothetical protein
MNVEVGRRVFVGSVVAGLPLLGAGARFASAPQDAATPVRGPVLDQLLLEMKGTVKASRGGQGQGRGRDLQTDPVLQEVYRQLQATEGEARAPRPGTWQRGASALSTLASWTAANGIDAEFRRFVEARGIGELACKVSERDTLGELRAMGFTLPPGAKRQFHTPTEYEQAITQVLKEGIGASLTRLARLLEDGERKGIGRVSVVHVALRQGGGESGAGGEETPAEAAARCAQIRQTLMLSDAVLVAFCLMEAFLCAVYGTIYLIAIFFGLSMESVRGCF